MSSTAPAAHAGPGRFLMVAIDAGGTLPPMMGVAAELVRRGHDVLVLADPTAEDVARAAGCDYVPWQTAPQITSVDDQTRMITEFETGSPLRRLRRIRERVLVGPAGFFARDVIDAAHRHGADAVLVEGTVPGMVIGAEATRLPFAALMANIYARPTRGLPPFGTGWSPSRNPLGRARDAVALATIRRVSAGMTKQLNAVRAAYGLAPVDELLGMLDHANAVLVLTSPSFDFSTPHLPSNVRYVGPQLDDPSWAARWDDPSDDPSADPSDDPRPLVLVGLSSVHQDQAETLNRICAALGRLPVRGLVTTGRAVDPARVTAPPNVQVVRAASHQQVLRRTAAVVTHAGHGTVMRSLAAGVPLVCIPMGRDQKDDTVRVLRLGAGVRVRASAAPEQIASAVRLVLEDEQYAVAARTFAAVLAEEARTRPSAADEAETLLGTR
ncbi:glycosyltransferase [Terrabacter sp. 2RAF25]|uniref:glycosyltransferase n=1 Tax=Terrabacter sp. 2RAF25 TaxID=3232998 RepID=UPI003F9833CE